jgi:hypothetical protein
MGLFANLFAGGALADASKQAAATQVAAMNNAMGTLNTQFGQTSTNYQPFINTGTAALNNYGNLLGLNGGTVQQNAITSLQNSPYFQSLYNQGKNAVLQNASATGGLRGGNTDTALYNLGQQTLAQTIQQQMANLGTAAQGFGLQPTESLGALGAQNASAIGNLQVGQGQAQAQDILTRGQLANSAWSGLGSLLEGGALSFLGGGAGLGSALGGLGNMLGGGAAGGTGGLLGALSGSRRGMNIFGMGSSPLNFDTAFEGLPEANFVAPGLTF